MCKEDHPNSDSKVRLEIQLHEIYVWTDGVTGKLTSWYDGHLWQCSSQAWGKIYGFLNDDWPRILMLDFNMSYPTASIIPAFTDLLSLQMAYNVPVHWLALLDPKPTGTLTAQNTSESVRHLIIQSLSLTSTTGHVGGKSIRKRQISLAFIFSFSLFYFSRQLYYL